MKSDYKYLKKYSQIIQIKERECCGCKIILDLNRNLCWDINCPFKPRFKVKKRILRRWKNE